MIDDGREQHEMPYLSSTPLDHARQVHRAWLRECVAAAASQATFARDPIERAAAEREVAHWQRRLAEIRS